MNSHTMPRWMDERTIEALRLYSQGTSAGKIAKAMGYPSRQAAKSLIATVRRADIAASTPLEGEATVRSGYRP